MFERLLHRNCSPIAIDLGGHSIKMLQLSAGSEKWSVHATAEYALPIDGLKTEEDRRAVVSEGLGRLMELGGFAGRTVMATVPEPFMRYKNVRLPRMSEAERAEAARWEAADRLELDDDPAQIEHLLAGEVRNGEETRDELILMAALEQQVSEYTEILLSAGLRPAALEPTPLPLMRCFTRTFRRETDQREPRVVVDLGAEATKVLIVRDGSVMFFKRIDIGGRRLDRAVADHLDMDIDEAARLRWRITAAAEADSSRPGEPVGSEAAGASPEDDEVRRAVADATRGTLDELAQEIGLCLRYFSVTFRGKRPEQVWLAGGGAHDQRVRQILEQKLESTIHVAEPFEGIDLSGPSVQLERRGRRCEWAVALGLAMRPISAASAKETAA